MCNLCDVLNFESGEDDVYNKVCENVCDNVPDKMFVTRI